MQLLPRCYPLLSQKMLSALSSGLLSRFFSWIVSISGSPLSPEDNMSFHKQRNGLGSVRKNHRICDLQTVKKLKRDHVEDHRMLAIFRCLKDSLTIIKKQIFAVFLSREIRKRASHMKGSLVTNHTCLAQHLPLWLAIWGNYLKPMFYYISSVVYY